MHVPRLVTFYLGELAELPAYLAVLFLLFAVLAYAFAGVRARALPRSWRDIREAVAPRAVYRRRTVRFDISIFWMQLFLVLPAVSFVGSLYTADRFEALIAARWGAPPLVFGADHPIMQTAVQVLAVQIFGTLGAYLFHYAGHKVPLFWTLHKVHHSAESLSPFTALRGHPIDTILAALVGLTCRTVVVGLALHVTGGRLTSAALTVFACTGLASLVQDALNHSHVPLTYGWFDRVWVGPLFHHLHHSIDPKHRDKNFGGGVPVWDWIFGTMYLPDPDEVLLLGLNDEALGDRNPHNSFKGYMIEPMREFAVELGRLTLGLGAAFSEPFQRVSARRVA